MEIIVGFLQQGFQFVFALVALLGILVFVHEMGHFLVAKYFGVRVEVFSLGFGKKLFKRKYGDTEYCLSLIPLGGYVKMFGDDPSADVPENMKQVSFLHKPVGQRIWIVLAGPLMNLFFAVLLFTLIAVVGEEMPKPVAGDINPSSEAGKAGFESGDLIQTINGIPVKTWDEFKKSLNSIGEGNARVTVQRFINKEVEEFSAPTKMIPNDNVLSSDLMVSSVEGLSPMARSSAVALRDLESIATKNGFQTGDYIVDVNGIAVTRWYELIHQIGSVDANATELSITFERIKGEKDSGPRTQVILPIPSNIPKDMAGMPMPVDARGESILNALGLERPELHLQDISKGSAAEKAGLKKGDRLLSLNGETLFEWTDLVTRVKKFQEGDPALKLKVRREGKELDVQLTPTLIETTSATGHSDKTWAIGVYTSLSYAGPQTFVDQTYSPIEAVRRGATDTVEWTRNTVLSFLRLLQNRVSAKSIGGPIMIGQIASRTIEVGISPFLKIMAIISINLFVMNLLPVPVLDGGHLLFYTIEALRGSPLSMRKMEVAQQVGLVLLMSLMVFALFNDVSRLLNL